MKLGVAGILTLGLLPAGCGSPSSPSGVDNAFTWTVDGQSFQATSNGRGALRAGTTVIVTGADCGRGPILMISMTNPSVGTLSVGSTLNANWTPDARTGSAAGTAWEAGPGRGSGTVTITSLTDGRVAGNFSMTLAPFGGSASGNRSVQGSFDLTFGNATIC